MDILKALRLGSALAGLSACGLPIEDPGMTRGEVGGYSLEVRDAVNLVFLEEAEILGAAILMSDRPELCRRLVEGRLLREETVYFDSRQYWPPGKPPENPGPPPLAQLPSTSEFSHWTRGFNHFDESCSPVLTSEASEADGSIRGHGDFFDSEIVTGKFDLEFGPQGQDSLVGSYTARRCEVQAAVLRAATCRE